MGWITMSCGELPSKALSPALHRLKKEAWGKFAACESDFHSVHVKLCLSCRYLYQHLRDHAVKSKRRRLDLSLKLSLTPEIILKNQLRRSASSVKSFFSSVLLCSSLKRRMDAAGKLCSFVVLKVLSWLFHHISSFCVFANKFNDPPQKKVREEHHYFVHKNRHTRRLFHTGFWEMQIYGKMG